MASQFPRCWVAKAMINTSLIVVSCFLSMLFSDFVPTAEFGLFFAAAIFAALAADLVLLPTLLLLMNWRFPVRPRASSTE